MNAKAAVILLLIGFVVFVPILPMVGEPEFFDVSSRGYVSISYRLVGVGGLLDPWGHYNFIIPYPSGHVFVRPTMTLVHTSTYATTVTSFGPGTETWTLTSVTTVLSSGGYITTGTAITTINYVTYIPSTTTITTVASRTVYVTTVTTTITEYAL